MRVARFIDGPAGRLFCIGALHTAPHQGRRRFLVIAPFAEELNKSRHVLAKLCSRLADAGHDVLMPDLFGTGDSEGDFGDASLEIWRSDLDTAIAYLGGDGAMGVVGLRSGALLAADLAARHALESLTLLHPQTDGRQQLTQMLRLRLAAGLMGGGEKETATLLRQRLAKGEALEIAGYRLSAELASGLESLVLAGMPPETVPQVDWIEVAPQPDRPLMPASQRVIDAWSNHGVSVDATVVVCDAFWATQEIAACAPIVDAALPRLIGTP